MNQAPTQYESNLYKLSPATIVIKASRV